MSVRARSIKIATLVTALAFPLTVAACGSDAGAAPAAPASASAPASTSAAAPSSSASMPMESPSASTSMASQPFGPACSAVPKTGSGSFDGMSTDPVATAASHNPVLSTLVAAVTKAGLVDTLNSATDITVFAPTNDAFAKIDKKTLNKVLADKKLLTAILTEHVVPGRLAPDMLPGKHDTLNKNQGVSVSGSGEDFKVNGSAKVVCGNVQTANATVYLIDSVLLPKS